ncbi:cell envelope integrity protein TolA [Halomonas salicampi]|uniref:Cell envelope integrity protein TolA n=1 Tax=Vreelandella salicampi TaxID=1449798 RepID=A0A7Z0LKQ5_9GAMM|nr:cell envelope integrity protein TolA [Halomonas salicampi]NYS60766.1 cell envelope integrity protein TolA [Halomonas salicampi]
MSKRRGRLVAFFLRDKQEVGYVWPAILAVLVHAVVVMFSVINLEGKDAEPESSSIVHATLVSTETYTNQAQQVNDDQAAMSASSQSPPEPPPQEAPAPPSRPLEEAVIDQAEELAADRDTQALEQARAEAEAQAQRRAEEAERQALEAAAREAERAEQQAEEQRRREELARQEQEAEAQRRRKEEQARQAQETEEQRRREEEQARQAQEAEEQRRREEEQARQAQEAAETERQRRLEGQAEAAANARQAEQAANSFISIVRRAVEQAWLIPGGASDTMSATVQVRLGPSGEVLATSVATSSGDSAFDRSAIQAVEHAAPFTELRELSSEQQRNLRQFNLRFTPGDVR